MERLAGKYNFFTDEFNGVANELYFFSKRIGRFEYLNENVEAVVDKRNREVVSDLILVNFKACIISWSNVFGQNDNRFHWKKLTDNEVFHSLVRSKIESYFACFGIIDWPSYRDSVLKFRNKHSAHRDYSSTSDNRCLELGIPFDRPPKTPLFDPMCEVVNLLTEIMAKDIGHEGSYTLSHKKVKKREKESTSRVFSAAIFAKI